VPEAAVFLGDIDTSDLGQSAVPAVVERMTKLLSWTPVEAKRQREQYEAQAEAGRRPLGHRVPPAPMPVPIKGAC